MNKVIIIGNLSKDPELKTTGSGKDVCKFTVAVNRRKKPDGTQEADFITCIAWDKLATLVTAYLKKGRKCCITGRLQTRTYDAQDGSKRYATEVLCEEVEFLPNANSQAPQDQSAPAAEKASELVPYEDDELPF